MFDTLEISKTDEFPGLRQVNMIRELLMELQMLEMCCAIEREEFNDYLLEVRRMVRSHKNRRP